MDKVKYSTVNYHYKVNRDLVGHMHNMSNKRKV